MAVYKLPSFFRYTTLPKSSIRRTIPVDFVYKNSLLYKFVLLVSVKQGDLYCELIIKSKRV